MITQQSAGDIVILTMQHGKVNTLDLEMLHEIEGRFKELARSQAKAVILTGVGNSFSAGVDLFRIVNDGEAYIKAFIPKLTEMLLAVFTFERPVVAAVNGHAIAGGCILAWACDHVIMARSGGRIGIPELLVGVPFPSLPLEVARFVLPAQHFQTVVYTGNTFEADDAARYGLVHEAVKPEELSSRALQVAKHYSSAPPSAFAATKRLMRQPVLDRHERYKGSLDKRIAKTWTAPETLANIRAYLEKTVGKKN